MVLFKVIFFTKRIYSVSIFDLVNHKQKRQIHVKNISNQMARGQLKIYSSEGHVLGIKKCGIALIATRSDLWKMLLFASGLMTII